MNVFNHLEQHAHGRRDQGPGQDLRQAAVGSAQTVGQRGLASIETDDGTTNQRRVEIRDDKVIAKVESEEHGIRPDRGVDSLPGLDVQEVQPLGMDEKRCRKTEQHQYASYAAQHRKYD